MLVFGKFCIRNEQVVITCVITNVILEQNIYLLQEVLDFHNSLVLPVYGMVFLKLLGFIQYEVF